MNIVLELIIQVAVLLVFLRVSLERFINWWNSAVDDSFEWNIYKSMPEYLELLKKKEKRQEWQERTCKAVNCLSFGET
jgi:hypothetical protein